MVSGTEAGGWRSAERRTGRARRRQTGKIQWKHKFPADPPFGATTVVNDLVFATTFEGTLYAFDTGSGNEVWETALPAGINAGIAVSGDTLLAPAGIPSSTGGQEPQIVAYRLP